MLQRLSTCCVMLPGDPLFFTKERGEKTHHKSSAGKTRRIVPSLCDDGLFSVRARFLPPSQIVRIRRQTGIHANIFVFQGKGKKDMI